MSDPAEFWQAARMTPPQVAVVLGSGLTTVAEPFVPLCEIPTRLIPNYPRSTAPGHQGRVALGHWLGVPTLVFFGRVHLYEGYPQDSIPVGVRLAAELGVTDLVLTNAAGGLHPELPPGSLMAIEGHRKMLNRDAWRTWESDPVGGGYSTEGTRILQEIEKDAGRILRSGVYAALTGPSYETPAEIRALAKLGIDAVGMSTALEAEAAVAAGMRVVAISTITNWAAGIGEGALSHSEVEQTARETAARLGRLLGEYVTRIVTSSKSS